MKDAWRHFIAEFIGTFALVFIGGGTIITSPLLQSQATVLNIAFAHGLILALMVTRDDAHLGRPSQSRGHGRISRHAADRADDGRDVTGSRSSSARSSRRTCSRRSIPPTSSPLTQLGGQRISADIDAAAGDRARGDRDVLPRVRRLRHRGRSKRGPKGRRLGDRSHDRGRHPRHRAAHRRVDEPGALVRSGRGHARLRGTDGVLGRADPRRDRGGAALRQSVPARSRPEPLRPRKRRVAPVATRIFVAWPTLRSPRCRAPASRRSASSRSTSPNDDLSLDELERRIERVYKAASVVRAGGHHGRPPRLAAPRDGATIVRLGVERADATTGRRTSRRRTHASWP